MGQHRLYFLNALRHSVQAVGGGTNWAAEQSEALRCDGDTSQQGGRIEFGPAGSRKEALAFVQEETTWRAMGIDDLKCS